MTINDNEKKCLKALVENTQPHGELCIGFQWVADEVHLTKKEVRRHIRALARKGLAEFYRGLFNDDGEVAGSGYCASTEGVKLIESELL
jgi:predicted ArsR family transcriptional regulator